MSSRILVVTAVVLLTGCGSRGSKPREITAGSGVPVATDVAQHDRSIRIGFWLGMKNNEILTPSMVQWIGERASLIVLNAEAKGPDPYFDYGELVGRFKARFPTLPVLLYSTAVRMNKTTKVYGAYFDQVTKMPWLLKHPEGTPVIQKGLRALVDITNPDYRKFLPAAIAKDVDRLGTDGIAFDGYHRAIGLGTEGGKARPEWYLDGKNIFARWPEASKALLAAAKASLGDRLVIFNGLWSRYDGQLALQAELLPTADGASVEFFAYDVREPGGGREQEFQHYVLDILDVMKAHPDKLYMVFGRSRRGWYRHYDDDYLTQRYALASYLLGATPRSMFKYHPHSQTRSMQPDRADGLSYYADFDLSIGEPLGDMTSAGGLYQRKYSRALVAVAPAWQEPRVLHLDRPHYTPEGERVEGDQAMPAGTGLILLTDPPAALPARIVVDDFEAGTPGEWQFPVYDAGTVVAEEAGNHYVQVRLAPDALQPYHERRLQPVRRLQPFDQLSLRVRSSDLAGAILVRVEVDDATPAETDDLAAGDDDDDDQPRRPALNARGRPRAQRGGPRPYAVLVLVPDGGTNRFRNRGRDIPYGELEPRGQVPYIAVTPGYAANGSWQTITLDAPAITKALAPNLTPRRLSEIRVLGNADLDDLVLTR